LDNRKSSSVLIVGYNFVAMKSGTLVGIIAAGMILCGFQQTPSPEGRKPNQKSSEATRSGPKQDAESANKPSTTQPSAPSSDTNSDREKGYGKQNIYVGTSEKSIDPVERIISIVGVVCTVALLSEYGEFALRLRPSAK
jgi:cobalamin biosynthesis Mg chelatase CobN